MKWSLCLILSLLAFNVVSISSAEDSSETLTLIWESEFSRDALLIAPSDMAADHEGNVYVSTQAPKHIKKFNSEGRLIDQWGDTGRDPGEFSTSGGIDVDSEGNVYVVDFDRVNVQKFDSEGNFLLEWKTEPPQGPASVVVDSAGFVYVDNFFHHAHFMQKFDSEGKLVHQWGKSGTEPGQFGARQEDLTLDADGYLYVADRMNHRIQKFDSEGNFVAVFGGAASKEGKGLFTEPGGVAVAADGSIYVIDFYFLQKLDAEGNFITQWALTGDLDRARGIVEIDQWGDLYVFAYTQAISAKGDPVNPLVMKKFRPA